MSTKSKKLTRPVLLIGKAENCPDIEYISGFRAVDPVVLLITSSKRYLVVPGLEYGRACSTGKRLEVLTPRDLNISRAKSRSISEWAYGLLNITGVKSVTVPRQFPLAAARRLERSGIKLVLAKGDIFPERDVKSVDEIKKIRESQQAAVIAMRAAISIIELSEISHDGFLKSRGENISSESIKRVIARVLLDHDCLGREIIVSHGPQTANPHEPGTGDIRAGEPVLLDIFPQSNKHGYWGDLSRTVVKGEPSRELKKMYSAVKAAQNAALSKIKPGVKCHTIHKTAAEVISDKGYKTGMIEGEPAGFIHNTGHGVGLEIHEGPSLGLSDKRLRRGNVITVEPGLYYPGTGGIRIEDTVQVTTHGWRYLVPCEKRFQV